MVRFRGIGRLAGGTGGFETRPYGAVWDAATSDSRVAAQVAPVHPVSDA